MNHRALFILSIALLSPAFSSETPVDELLFRPTEGLALTKMFRFSWESESERESGERQSTSSSSLERELVVSDVYLAVEEGRTTKLERTFDRIQSVREHTFDHDGTITKSRATATSDLEKETVLFERDDDA